MDARVTWRLLLINPLATAAVLLLGVGGCRLAGVNPHATAGGIAAAAGLLASAVAVTPLLRTRWPHPAAATQAALLALVVHLGLMLALGLAAVAAVGTADRLPLALWTLVVFWATLAGVATVAARAVNAEATGNRAG